MNIEERILVTGLLNTIRLLAKELPIDHPSQDAVSAMVTDVVDVLRSDNELEATKQDHIETIRQRLSS